MKRFKAVFLVLVIMFSFNISTIANAQDTPIKIILNGNTVPCDAPPFIENGRTLVPFRAIFEALGVNVNWNGDTKTVTGDKDDINIRLNIGENIIYINSVPIELDVPAKIVNSRTMVPVRAVSEAFKAKVYWQGLSRTVIISTDILSNVFYENTMRAKNIHIKGSVDFIQGVSSGTYNIVLDADLEKKRLTTRQEYQVGSTKDEIIHSYSKDSAIKLVNGISEPIELYKELDTLLTINAPDPLLFINEESGIRVYEVINPQTGLSTGSRIYLNTLSGDIEKIILPKEVLSETSKRVDRQFTSDMILYEIKIDE